MFAMCAYGLRDERNVDVMTVGVIDPRGSIRANDSAVGKTAAGAADTSNGTMEITRAAKRVAILAGEVPKQTGRESWLHDLSVDLHILSVYIPESQVF